MFLFMGRRERDSLERYRKVSLWKRKAIVTLIRKVIVTLRSFIATDICLLYRENEVHQIFLGTYIIR